MYVYMYVKFVYVQYVWVLELNYLYMWAYEFMRLC